MKVTIKREKTIRYTGVSNAARKLGVSRQALTNYLRGNDESSISSSKRRQIKIIDK